MLAVTKGAVYICVSSSELHTLFRVFTDAGGHWSTFVIWVKHHFTLGRSDYQRQYEPILYGWRQWTDHFWCATEVRAMIVRRWEQYTGKPAVLDADGRTFDEVAQERLKEAA
jgi:DNA modification methylase